jgi:hypothetical protein
VKRIQKIKISVKDKTGRPCVWDAQVDGGRWSASYDGQDGTIQVSQETLGELDLAIREEMKKHEAKI